MLHVIIFVNITIVLCIQTFHS